MMSLGQGFYLNRKLSLATGGLERRGPLLTKGTSHLLSHMNILSGVVRSKAECKSDFCRDNQVCLVGVRR